jgi:hypothetical protein
VYLFSTKKTMEPPCLLTNLGFPQKKGWMLLQVLSVFNKMDVVVELEENMAGSAQKQSRGRPSTGFPRWAPRLLSIEAEHIQSAELAKLLGITKAAVYLALVKHDIFVSLQFEDGHYRGYYETAILHDLARRAIAREQDATKSSISLKRRNKEVGLCS